MTSSIPEFRESILARGKLLYRDMPWRGIDDAYGVLVSEVMLQQTQVSRVQNRWVEWMRAFPTVESLARAQTPDVLMLWMGLGYNRRALNLKRACEVCFRDFAGEIPNSEEDLRSLPGIGPATAAGVIAFAFDRPSVYLETNVRAVFIQEFFPDKDRVPDSWLVPLVREACPDTGVREWYYALLDVGASLKAEMGKGANPSRKSTSFTKQSAFEGSHRQRRAELVRIVLAEPGIPASAALTRLNEVEISSGRKPIDDAEFLLLTSELTHEGFFRQGGNRLYL